MEELLSKCAALDGFSFNAISKSSAIREFITKRGYTMPNSPKTVKEMVIKFADDKKNQLRQKLGTMKESGVKFSITVDEWTNFNTRFVNVTLNSFKNEFKLGLVKVKDSLTSERITELVGNKLLEFGLNFTSDIVASTHDGASVMQKYGKLNGIENQLCYNHAIHLAVVDIFYTKKDYSSSNNTGEESDSEEDEGSNSFDENDDDEDSEENSCLKTSIFNTIAQVRSVVKMFKRSAVKNDTLQKYIKIQEGKELMLLCDCKTRWNSLIPMIERFVKVKECLFNAFKDLGCRNLCTQNLFSDLTELLKVLEPLEISITKLSNEKSNLLIAEGTLIFLFEQLAKSKTALSDDLLHALKTRILDRRNKILISLIIYLNTGSVPKDNKYVQYASKKTIQEYAARILKRIYTEQDYETEVLSEIPEIGDSDNLSNELEKNISMVLSSGSRNESGSIELKNQFKLLESTKTLTGDLKKLFESLMSVRPTSTSSERVFSTANTFKTKIRNRMAAKTLDSLVFLKYYFLESNKN